MSRKCSEQQTLELDGAPDDDKAMREMGRDDVSEPRSRSSNSTATTVSSLPDMAIGYIIPDDEAGKDQKNSPTTLGLKLQDYDCGGDDYDENQEAGFARNLRKKFKISPSRRCLLVMVILLLLAIILVVTVSRVLAINEISPVIAAVQPTPAPVIVQAPVGTNDTMPITCPPVPGGGCAVCGPGLCVGLSDEVFSSFSGQPTVACGTLEKMALAGQLPINQCEYLPSLIKHICGCTADSKRPGAVLPTASDPVPQKAFDLVPETAPGPVTVETQAPS